MENNNEITLDQLPEETKRPDMLKVLCILTFVACGLELLAFGFGTLLLAMSQETIMKVWENVLETNPQLADTDPLVFFHQVGMYCLYAVIVTIFSLLGAIMMWRMDKIGLIIYTVAELAMHFFTIEMPQQSDRSMGGLIIGVGLDLIFIILYFTQIKYFKKKLA